MKPSYGFNWQAGEPAETLRWHVVIGV